MKGLHQVLLECISEDEINKIHDRSIHILEKKGMVVHHEGLRERAREKGAKIENEIVYFPRKLVEDAIEMAPTAFDFHSRNEGRKITIGKDNVLSAVHGPPFILDESGRREGTLQDYINFIKLTHQLDNLNLTGGIFIEPNDVPKPIRHVELLFQLYKHTDKPLLFVATGEEKSKEIIEMASLVSGDREALMRNPGLILSVNPASPLKWDNLMAGTIFEFAKNRQPLIICPAAIIGVTGPISPLGTCLLQNTEILSGITLAQLIREGTPVVYSPYSSAANMKNANFIIGSPEATLMNMAAIQMSNFYNLPCRASAYLTDAKTLDCQAGYESVFSFLLQALAFGKKGFFFSQAGVTIDSYMSTSYEKVVADDELTNRFLKILKGLDTSEDSYSLDVIMEVGHHGDYLTHPDTYNHFRERWLPTVATCETYEDWEEKGRVDFVARCRGRVKTLIDSYVEPELDKTIEKQLRGYIEKIKA